MIESNVIEWLDFGDATQKIDVYSRIIFIPIFRFWRILLKNKLSYIIIDIIFLFLFFLQIWTISLINVAIEKEFFLDILNYLKIVINLYEAINNAATYENFIISFFVIILFNIVLNTFVFVVNRKIDISYLAILINLIYILIFYYLLGPVIITSLMSLWCENKNHKYLKVVCFSNSTHLIYLIISFANILFYITGTFFFSFYGNEIDILSKNSRGKNIRINCYYELYCLISKVCIFSFGYFFYSMDYEEEEDILIKLLFEGFILLNSLIMSIYVYKNVYFYNNVINLINHFGWYFTFWFSFCIILKSVLNLTGISNFITIGWIIITFVLSKAYLMNENILITEANIFELNNLKSIEMLKNTLLIKLSEKNQNKIKILLFGIIKKFEEFISNNPEINYQYQKLINDKNLNKKFNREDTLPILSIIYLLYTYYLEKLTDKNELTLHLCYFLINKLDNRALAMLLCSKLKSETHKDLYYKYLLTKDIKDYLIEKLKKYTKKESIKHVEIGSVILYNLYIDLFKIKIYDGLCSQIDYFDLLKNTAVTNKTTENFLKTGENIFKNRDEIKIIWDKIIELNPFSDDAHRDYLLYLDTIVQDESLSRDETKKYMLLKNSKSQEKFNVYHTMFLNNTSSVLLIDGYLSNGKILYATQNFSGLFMYSGKELLNLTVDDLLPNCVQTFHKELINDAIKYSNVKNIFKEPNDSLLKNKMNGLFSTKLFIKPVPNLSYGLVYFTYLQKVHDSSFNIILDKDLKINGFSEMTQSGSAFTMNNGYNLSQKLIGNHVGLIIPDILPLLEYKNEEFNIIKKDYELKGYLYPVENVKDIKCKLDIILEKIKNNKVNINDFQGNIEDDPQNISSEFNDLMNELSIQKIKPFSIFYKIQLRTFIEGKYKYYKISINNDIISESQINPMKNEAMEIKDNKKEKNKITVGLKTDIIKESTKKIKINVQEKNTKAGGGEKNIQNNNAENSNLSKHSRLSADLNNKVEANTENQEKSNKNNDNNNNENEKNREKLVGLARINSISNYNSKTIVTIRRCNKIKNEIMNKEIILPLKIMTIICFLFLIISIIFMILDLLEIEKAFVKLCNYLQCHLLFSDIKINIGTLYTLSVNVRWMSHSMYRESSKSHLNEEWTDFYKNLLEENLALIQDMKTFAYQVTGDFEKAVKKRYKVGIYSYKFSESEIFDYNLDNMFSYIINNQIKLLDKFDYFHNTNCETIKTELGLQEINLKNLIETSYFLYKLKLNIFDDPKEVKKNAENIFYYFPFSFLISGLIFLLFLFVYAYFTLKLNNIEINFLDKLINFNSNEFDNYIKKLDEIKKKLRNDNNEEEDKGEDIDLNELDSKKKDDDDGEKNDIIVEKNSEEFEKKRNRKKMRSKQSKIQQQRRKKLSLMITYFWSSNIFFQIKVALIFVLTLGYYIINILISKSNRNDYLKFDEMNDSLNDVYEESISNFVRLKRELDKYELYYTDCNTINNASKMNIPRINNITIPKFGNLIMQISRNSDFQKKTLQKFNNLYSNDACEQIMEYSYQLDYCKNFWSGVLTKGIEQAITQMGVVIGTVVDELQALNDDPNLKLSDLLSSSSFIEYEQFNQYYLFKSYKKTSAIFNELRDEKLKAIKTMNRLILYFYIVAVILLFALFYYFLYKFSYLFNSFLNFIAILPIKYISEDENFYNEIIKFGDKYY